MKQTFKQEFYKKVITQRNNKIYLFKTFEFIKNKKVLVWLSCYGDKKKNNFIVESGAGITFKRMENQISEYLGVV